MWLNRRSAKTRMTWERFERLIERYPLPGPCPARMSTIQDLTPS